MIGSPHLTRDAIRRLLSMLDAELAATDTRAELYLVGGAVMCLAFGARESTLDVDALFKPAAEVRRAAARVAVVAGISESWLNDGVKGWLSARGDFDRYLELPNLNVFVAHPRYLLAMKCVAMRLGEEFHDLDDVRYLLRHLNLESSTDALAIVESYFDATAIPLKTRLALQEILGR